MQSIAPNRSPAPSRPQDCRARQRGTALITVLMVMTTVTIVGLATHELVQTNVQLSGAQYQARVARGGAVLAMNAFRQLGRPRLAALVPSGFLPTENIDLTGNPLIDDISDSLTEAARVSGGALQNPTYAYDGINRQFVSVDYLRRGAVPPGNQAQDLYPSTINNGQFCADHFRIITMGETGFGSKGAVDQKMFIVSPCLAN